MKELFYFSTTDVMVAIHKTDIAKATWKSHRALSEDEKLLVDRYLNEQLTGENDNYSICQFTYGGIDFSLVKEMAQFKHLKQNKNLAGRQHAEHRSQPQPGHGFYDRSPETSFNREINNSVQDLINAGMADYYFDAIGRKIRQVREAEEELNVEQMQSDLAELVLAYNSHAPNDQHVTVFKAVPADLHQVLGLDDLKV